jgi:hypothetical protein
MLVTRIDDSTYNWKPKDKRKNNASKLHKKARDLLKSIFENTTTLEEVKIEPMSGVYLYIDIYIPVFMTAIEVHGEQHYNYTPFYHKNLMDFVQSKQRDNMKKRWCELNDITLIELPYNEVNEWQTILLSQLTSE